MFWMDGVLCHRVYIICFCVACLMNMKSCQTINLHQISFKLKEQLKNGTDMLATGCSISVCKGSWNFIMYAVPYNATNCLQLSEFLYFISLLHAACQAVLKFF